MSALISRFTPVSKPRPHTDGDSMLDNRACIITATALRICYALARGSRHETTLRRLRGVEPDLVEDLVHAMHALGMVRIKALWEYRGETRTVWSLVQ
jgi:hypothetical protein